MKKKHTKKFIFLLGLAIFASIAVTVSAAFVFIRIVSGTATTGDFEITEQKYLYYEVDSDGNRAANATEYDVTTNTTDTDKGLSIENGIIKSYASQKQGYSDELPYCQLNQLGIKVSLTTDIDVYVRLRVQDAWISHKVYKNGSQTQTYILKGTAISDALTGNDDWLYDSQTGYIYYKTKLLAGSDISVSFSFPSDYKYEVASASYRESIIVDFSYKVDVIQANRVDAVWGIDLSQYIS